MENFKAYTRRNLPAAKTEEEQKGVNFHYLLNAQLLIEPGETGGIVGRPLLDQQRVMAVYLR